MPHDKMFNFRASIAEFCVATCCISIPARRAESLSVKLLKYLANLGYGSRREVAHLIAAGRVTRAGGGALRDGDDVVHDEVRVDGEALDPAPGLVVLLHKPVGYVCSTRGDGPLVYELLPPRFLLRSPVLAPVGRLDRDTSGALLLTDDGALNHRLTAPRAHVAKTYAVTLAHDLRGNEAEMFASGTLLLDGETTPLRPASLTVIDARTAHLTITEGRYHQVRRMFVAVGNHVQLLHRAAIGPLQLDVAPAAWRLLLAHEIAGLTARSATSLPPAP